MLARMLQALPAPPAAVVLAVPPSTVFSRVERLADNQLRGRGGQTVMEQQHWRKHIPKTSITSSQPQHRGQTVSQ